MFVPQPELWGPSQFAGSFWLETAPPESPRNAFAVTGVILLTVSQTPQKVHFATI